MACQVEEALTEVEDALHAETELSDRPGITRLGVQSKRANCAAIACLEPPVIQHPKSRALEQHVVGCRTMTRVKPERQGLCSRVVCVLHEFLQDREAASVTIAQIDSNLIDVVGGESSHFSCPLKSSRLRPRHRMLAAACPTSTQATVIPAVLVSDLAASRS